MKLNVFVDKNQEEKIDIYIHKKRKLIEDIENLINGERDILGYSNGEIYKLNFSEIFFFTVEKEKTKAVTETGEFTLKERLYVIEEAVPSYFVKLNKSCIGNIQKFRKFDTSVSGTLKVIFKNGCEDYVSRRQVKAVKERLGL